MKMKKRKKRSSSALALVFLLALAVLAVLYVQHQSAVPLSSVSLSWVSPGWEIYDSVGALRYNSQIYSQESQFTSPHDLLGNYWKVDVDDPNYGVPTIEVTVGDIHHVDFSGRDIPSDQPAASLTVTRANHTYYLDDHIYLYTVTIRTIADVVQSGSTVQHETLWPYDTIDFFKPMNIHNTIGKKFTGGFYTKFVISPWKGVSYRQPPSPDYVLNESWAGVMNTYVLNLEQGQVKNQYNNGPYSGMPPDDDAKTYISGTISQGNQIPMFTDDGTFGNPAAQVQWGSNLTPDTRILSDVVDYLPVDMGAGAKVATTFVGDLAGLYPCDVYVMYTLRVDVLQTHDFILKTAVSPPTPSAPVDYVGWAQGFWTSFLHGLDPFGFLGSIGLGWLEPIIWWIITFGIIILIMIVLVSVFAPWVLPRLVSTAKSTYKAVKG
jgi:hypothetical protein